MLKTTGIRNFWRTSLRLIPFVLSRSGAQWILSTILKRFRSSRHGWQESSGLLSHGGVAMRRGVDVSSNNKHPIDWVSAYKSGIEVAMVKLTEGTTYFNPYAVKDAAGAKAAGMEVWLYHFATTKAAKDEANYFMKYAALVPNNGLCLDYEPNVPSVDSGWIREFLDYSQAGMLYSNEGRMQQMTPEAKRGVKLWSASYGTGKPKNAVDAWQFTDKANVPGIQGNVDSSYVYWDKPGTPAPTPIPTSKVAPLFSPPWQTCDVLLTPTGQGAWLLQPDGGIATFGDAPFFGSAAGKPFFSGRTGARIFSRDDGHPGYMIVATSGEKYSFPI